MHFNLGYGEDFSRWSSDWLQFKNTEKSIKDLQWLIRLIEFQEDNKGTFDSGVLASTFLGGQEWIMGPYLSDWKAKGYDKLDSFEQKEEISELARLRMQF